MGTLDKLRFDPDPIGISQEFKYHESDDSLVVRSVQDVEPILKNNHALRREADEGNRGYSPSGEWRRAASIPNSVIHRWLMEGVNIFDDEAWPTIAGRLDDPSWSDLRTAPGHIGKNSRREYPLTRRW